MRLAAITLASLLFACAPVGIDPAVPIGDVTLTAAPTQVRSGATVTLTLRNGSLERLSYNLCTSAILTTGGSPLQTDRVCTMELRSLEPGRSTTYPFELPPNITPGTYRFSTGFERMPSGTRANVTSNTITVQ